MSKAEFFIVYDGPALEGSQMDVADLAPALLALRTLLHEANMELNGSGQSIQLKVRASFQTGCFGIDLVAVQGIVKDILSLFNTDDFNGALNLIETIGLAAYAGGKTIQRGKAGLLQTIQWIRNRKIDEIRIDEEGPAVILIDDDRLEVETEVIKLLRSQKIRESVDDLIYKPLEKDGIDSFAAKQNSQGVEFSFKANKADHVYFKSPSIEDEKIEDVEFEATYEVISPVFQEDNKWRMSDGSKPFFVEMQDENFIASVLNGEQSFTKGDLLTMLISESKILTESGLKTSRKALTVLSRRSRARQLPLPIKISTDD